MHSNPAGCTPVFMKTSHPSIDNTGLCVLCADWWEKGSQVRASEISQCLLGVYRCHLDGERHTASLETIFPVRKHQETSGFRNDGQSDDFHTSVRRRLVRPHKRPLNAQSAHGRFPSFFAASLAAFMSPPSVPAESSPHHFYTTPLTPFCTSFLRIASRAEALDAAESHVVTDCHPTPPSPLDA
ncbi:hypothetical protein Bbelb_337390 [Branchiostoma belcheri]|nr:hypothetical protein Bbelb_337390 [Branchiostoma belcheri]